jgi:hypothetical protein
VLDEAKAIREDISKLADAVSSFDRKNERTRDELIQKATAIGDRFLRLEKCALKIGGHPACVTTGTWLLGLTSAGLTSAKHSGPSVRHLFFVAT